LHELAHVYGYDDHDAAFYRYLWHIHRQFYRLLSPVGNHIEGRRGFVSNHTHRQREFGMQYEPFMNMCGSERVREIFDQLDNEARDVPERYWNERFRNRYIGQFGHGNRRPEFTTDLSPGNSPYGRNRREWYCLCQDELVYGSTRRQEEYDYQDTVYTEDMWGSDDEATTTMDWYDEDDYSD